MNHRWAAKEPHHWGKLAERGLTLDAEDVADTPTMCARNVAQPAALERFQNFDATLGRTRRSIGQE
ncbi:hypothetical protein AUF62_01800 [archaeon 13_1_20CM_52_20]|nr:MAG: hypothetical protein AUF62_01800 [archaeon 13_1_20CM_52_20]